jgi:SAM-dependent methyltransferase
MSNSKVQIAEQEQSEIERSAAEARKTVVNPISDVERYLAPPADTIYPLEYAFHLLGDVAGKTVLDFGCGSGENLVPLVRRGARTVGLDISPDLIALAQKRLADAGLEASLAVRSAYETGLPDKSVDVIFCIALVHHLQIPIVCEEMRRILAPHGTVILNEPIRFSTGYARLRSLLPAHEDISDFEHPLTRPELDELLQGFVAQGVRLFRLPIVPLVRRTFRSQTRVPWRISNWALQNWPFLERYATCVVMKLQSRTPDVQP